MTEQNPNDVDVLMTAAKDALTDGMVERLATTAGNGMEVVDRLNDPETMDAVMALIDGLTEMHRSGALDTMLQLVSVIHAGRNALTDGMVERLFTFVEHMANTVATEEIANLAHETNGALQDALDQSAKTRTSGGMMSTLKMVTSPEAQKTMAFLLAFGANLQKRTTELQRAED